VYMSNRSINVCEHLRIFEKIGHRAAKIMYMSKDELKVFEII